MLINSESLTLWSLNSECSMTCFVQNLCKWLFICPSILFYWILLDDTKLQISLPVKTGLRQQFFRDRECPLNESEIKSRSSIKRSVGTLMSTSKILVLPFFQYLSIWLFNMLIRKYLSFRKGFEISAHEIKFKIFFIWISRKSDIFRSTYRYKEPKSSY